MNQNALTSLVAIALLGVAACAVKSEPDATDQASSPLLSLEPTASDGEKCSSIGNSGQKLFKCETFGGNGRTCATCHSAATGTFSPAEAQALYAKDPGAPLFRKIDSDFGLGLTYTRLLNDAVIRAGVDLPPNVSILEMPGQRTVFLNRGVPTTLDTPALDPVLMYDGRAPNLQAQALGAIHGHMEPTIEPTSKQLDAIATFEKTLFSSDTLRDFAAGRATPVLPPGNTAAEKRGRVAFVDGPQGKCAFCHSGPMLNQTNAFNVDPAVPAGSRFATALVSEFNSANNPVLTFLFTNPDGSVTPVATPDPGRGLITGNAGEALPAQFKIPTLWNVKNTAPYFHDNSAKTLEDVGLHYQKMLAVGAVLFNAPQIVLTNDERDDIVAYMKLL
jgi:cytochrome c peroxidase